MAFAMNPYFSITYCSYYPLPLCYLVGSAA